MLDDDIDFKIDDYIKYYLKDHKLNTTIKNTVILMLKKNSALDENDNNRIYMDSILNQIDNKLLQITNKYIQDESFVQSRKKKLSNAYQEAFKKH